MLCISLHRARSRGKSALEWEKSDDDVKDVRIEKMYQKEPDDEKRREGDLTLYCKGL